MNYLHVLFDINWKYIINVKMVNVNVINVGPQ